MRIAHLFETKSSDAGLLALLRKNPMQAAEQIGKMAADGLEVSIPVQMALVQFNGHYLRLLPNAPEEVQLKAVSTWPDAIQFIARPSPDVQMAAVRVDTSVIRFINHQDPAVRLWVVNQSPACIRWMPNSTPEEQETAINKQVGTFTEIENPTLRVCLLAAGRSPILIHDILDRVPEEHQADVFKAAFKTDPGRTIKMFDYLPLDLQHWAFDNKPSIFPTMRRIKNLDPVLDKKWDQYTRKADRKFKLPMVGKRRAGDFNLNQDQLRLVRWFEVNEKDSITVKELKQQPWGNTPYLAQLVRTLGGRDITKSDVMSPGKEQPFSADVAAMLDAAELHLVPWTGLQKIFDEDNMAAVFSVKSQMLKPYVKQRENIGQFNAYMSRSTHPKPPSRNRHLGTSFSLERTQFDSNAIENDSDAPLGWVRFTRFGKDIWIDEVQSDLTKFIDTDGDKLKDLPFALLLTFVQRMRRRGAERFYMPSHEMKTDTTLYNAQAPASIYQDLPRKMRFKKAEVSGIDPKVDGQTAWLLEGFKRPDPASEHDEVLYQLAADRENPFLPDHVRDQLQRLSQPEAYRKAMAGGKMRMVSPKEAAMIGNTGDSWHRRGGHDAKKKAGVLKAASSGATLPAPIVLHHTPSGEKWLLAGHHRLSHHSQVAGKHTPVLHISYD